MNGNNNQPNMIPGGSNGGNPNIPNNANKGGGQAPSLSAVNNPERANATLASAQSRQGAVPSGKRAEDYKRSNISGKGLKGGEPGGSTIDGSASIPRDKTVSGDGEVKHNADFQNKLGNAKVKIAQEAIKKYAAAHGVPEGVAAKALNSKAATDALNRKLNRKGLGGRALDALNNIADKSMNNKPDSEKTTEEKSDEEEERKLHSGDLSFDIPKRVLKWLLIIGPAAFLILVFTIIIAGEIVEEKASSMILGDIVANNDKDIGSLIGAGPGGNAVGGDSVAVTVGNKQYPEEYFERLSYLGNNYTSKAKCLTKDECMTTDEFLYYLKVADISLRYKHKYNINLDWSLIVATDLYITKSTEENMKANLSNYDKDNVTNYNTMSELDWDNDFKHMSGYVYLNANDSRYDLNILAKNMVKKKTTQTCTDSNGSVVKRQEDEDLEDVYIKGTKKLNCDAGQSYYVTSTYTKDLDKFDEFMLEFIDKKMLTPGYGNGGENCTVSGSNNFIWPIGSKETTQANGKDFALGDPVSTTITSRFGSQESFRTSGHGAIDIASSSGQAGVDNVIASKAGKVLYPTDRSQTTFADSGYYGNPDGGGYGNYVIIEHDDGLYTLYGHLAKGSITVLAGEQVEQGQVIGKLGHSGSSTGPHLHFEMRKGGNSSANRVDPLEYVDPNTPRSGTSVNCSTAASGLADAFVKLALAQLQDPSASGGQKYWSLWFSHRVAWCACFVSWNIANTEYNGQKLSDVIDLTMAGKPGDSCVFNFMNWAYKSSNPNVSFKYNDNCSRYAGKNGSGTYTPKQGDLIFFDWAASWSGTMPTCFDCGPDHIGIVQKTEGGTIYTIEGNSSNSVRERTYALNSCQVIGFASWY